MRGPGKRRGHRSEVTLHCTNKAGFRLAALFFGARDLFSSLSGRGHSGLRFLLTFDLPALATGVWGSP